MRYGNAFGCICLCCPVRALTSKNLGLETSFCYTGRPTSEEYLGEVRISENQKSRSSGQGQGQGNMACVVRG